MKKNWIAYVPDVCGAGLILIGTVKDEPITLLLGAVVYLVGIVNRVDSKVTDMVRFHAFQAAMSKVIADQVTGKVEQEDAPSQE